MKDFKWDVFISYSHEDKKFAEELANMLISMGLNVWYDNFILELGDSLTKKINEGLANSRYGVVILSYSFFKKSWTQLEISALLNNEIDNRKIILPVWHRISLADLKELAPLLVDKLAANSDRLSTEQIAYQIFKVLKPERIIENSNEIIEIDWIDKSKIIILPLHPFTGLVIGISKYPITNYQYKKYLLSLNDDIKRQINWRVKEYINGSYNEKVVDISFKEPLGEIYDGNKWLTGFYPWLDTNFNSSNMPVVCVSLLEALAYSIGVDIKSSEKYNNKYNTSTALPTFYLWDYAAFGKTNPEKKASSWLNTTKAIHQKASYPIEIFNDGERTNLRGFSDMIGNVWEWCWPNEISRIKRPAFGLLKNDKAVFACELRGGSYLDNLNEISPFWSSSLLENGLLTRHTDLGFRIAVIIDVKMLDKQLQSRLWEFKESSEQFIKQYDSRMYY